MNFEKKIVGDPIGKPDINKDTKKILDTAREVKDVFVAGAEKLGLTDTEETDEQAVLSDEESETMIADDKTETEDKLSNIREEIGIPEVAETTNEQIDSSDEEFESEIDQEPSNFDNIIEGDEATREAEQDIEGDEEATEPSEQEIAGAEQEMQENNFDPKKYVNLISNGFRAFSDRIKSEPGLDKGAGEKFSEVAKKFTGEAYKDFENAMAKIDDLYKQGKESKATEAGMSFVQEAKEKAKEYFEEKVDEWFKEHDNLADEAASEKDQSKKEKLLKLAMEAVDFVPFVGDLKMITEGAVGRTAQGKELKGFKRLIHTAEGVTFLALNSISAGVGGTLAKGVKGAKVLTRSAAVLRKIGLSRKIYKPLFKTGQFVAKHPIVGKVVDKAFNYIRGRRKKRQVKVVKEGVDTIFNKDQTQAA